MEASSTQKFIHMSPRKVRLVANSVRGKSLAQALVMLNFMTKRAALPVKKAILSASANAVNNGKLSQESLKIKRIEIQEGPRLKRFRAASKGMAHPYKKRMSHIKVIVEGEI